MTSDETAVAAPGRRAQARARLEADVLRLGREQLATLGAPALSLRQIARDLGMVSSAVYRYVASRDDLLTMLLIDAYDELADHVVARLDAAGDIGDVERLAVIAHAVREWALAEPARYALLYGSPVPGYEAPSERTSGPGTRVVALILRELEHGDRGRSGGVGALGSIVAGMTESVSVGFAAIRREFDSALDDSGMLMATCVWALILGTVSLEVFGQYGSDTFSDPRALFDLQVRTMLAGVLPSSPDDGVTGRV